MQATKALRAGRGIALPFLKPRHWRWGWVVSTTPRPLYPQERPGTHCTGDWTIWTDAGNLASTGILSPDRPVRSESLYRQRYRGSQWPSTWQKKFIIFYQTIRSRIPKIPIHSANLEMSYEASYYVIFSNMYGRALAPVVWSVWEKY